MAINNGFDCLNVRVPYHKVSQLKSGFGVYEEEQIQALKSFLYILSNVKWRRKIPTDPLSTTKKPFQRGDIFTLYASLSLLTKL